MSDLRNVPGIGAKKEKDLMELGYDPVYGARPMKRVLQAKVETLVARKLIAGAALPGDTLVVDAADNEAGFAVTVQSGHRIANV